jgi:sugar transferase (PEP-CTERM/EpsH1 system associated)
MKLRELMRILFIAHRTPFPPNKGDKIRAFWELRALAKGHEVDLFCFYDDPEDEPHLRQLGHYCEQYYAEKVSYFWSRARAMGALLRGRPFSTAFFYSRKMSRQIQAALRTRGYDRIFVFSSSVASYVESSSNIPRIVDLVDVDSDKWQQYASCSRGPWAWISHLEARRLAAYESFLARRFDATVLCTETEARLLRSRVPTASIQVLQNYLDVAQYDPEKIAISDEIRSWQPFIVFSGSMDYFPNVDAARYFYREVLPVIHRVRPEIRFVIAGRNPHSPIRELASDPAVKVTGSVADIRPYLSAAAVAVAPMRIARGVQNKVLEALACGVPVVTSTAVASALDDNIRRLVSPADRPDDFAALVLEALADEPGRSMRLRTGLRHCMENLALDDQLENLIAEPGAVSRGREVFHPAAERLA